MVDLAEYGEKRNIFLLNNRDRRTIPVIFVNEAERAHYFTDSFQEVRNRAKKI